MKVTVDKLISLINSTDECDNSIKDLIKETKNSRTKRDYVNNYIIYRTIINSINRDMVDRIDYINKTNNYEKSLRLNKLLLLTRELNIIEPELLYRDFNNLLKDLNRTNLYILKSHKEDVISNILSKKKISDNCIQNASIKYGSLGITDTNKWNFNRLFLLESVSRYKLFLMINFIYDSNYLEPNSISKEIEELKLNVSKLYRNKFILFKEDYVQFKLPKTCNTDLLCWDNITSDEYLEPILYLASTRYYNMDNVSDDLIKFLCSINRQEILFYIPKMKERIEWLYQKYY